MTASVLKQDPNTQIVQKDTIRKGKNKKNKKPHSMQIFEAIPFIKLQNDT